MRLIHAIGGSPARRNSVGSLVIQGSQRLARITTIVVSAAVLDPVPFARLAVALALTDLIRSALLAYDVSAVRLMASGRGAPDVLGSHLGAKLTVAISGTIAIVAFSAIAYDAPTTLLVVIASVGTLPVGVTSLLLVRRQVDFKLRSAAVTVAVGSVLGAGLAVAGLLVTREAVAVSAGLAAGDILILTFLARGLTEAGRIRPSEVVAVIRGAGTLLFMQLAYIGQFRVGTVVLGAFGAAVAVGEYTVASRVAEGLVILAAAVTASSLPMMGGAFSRGDGAALERTVTRSYRLSLLAATPIIVLLGLTSPIWVGILFPRYPGAATVFVPVGITVVVYFASSQTSTFLNASHRDRIAAGSAVTGVVAATIGSWWLVGMGAIGVAVARLAGELLRLSIETVAIARVAPFLMNPMAMAWLAVGPVLGVVVLLPALRWAPPAVALGIAVTVAWCAWLAVQHRGSAGR